MPNFSKHEVVLVRHPFSDLTGTKVRPAVIIGTPHVSQDVFIVPLTSKTLSLLQGEFLLADWKGAGLNVPRAVKRGVYTVHESLVVKKVGKVSETDVVSLDTSLRNWLNLP
ncbi:MAG: type II toxin-antitoxin system PemK/MazF family toxin [Nitrospirales bacterium]